ncbi:LuxR C-terminal-related transcriptional regulator [Pseudomonas sp. W03]|uniref:LuxR C-terminal-related transcriptional regulator n=1 Tax=Pseudomonas sp. W03 TaxID=3090666 RepID=UPI003A4DF1EC
MTINPARHLVSTKFSPPRIGTKHVPRANLIAQLDQMHECRLALITGAAGYGKTTLLAQWRQARLKAGAEVAWISLTADDKGYAPFCTALIEALRRLGVGVEFDLLQEDGTATAMDATIAAIVDAAENLSKELYLILDDYHHVEVPLAHKLVQKLLDQGPGNLHLVIASRVAPPLSLSRLRVMQQVVEIESVTLPFDPAETRTFVEENLGRDKLNADELNLIHELTSGWPSCLQLIVIMLKNRPDTRSILHDLIWRSSDLQTYLSEEVVEHLPAELVEFAEALSLFRRFNAAMARAVTDRADAAELIKRMEDENLLIYRVDSDDRLAWYRLHPLFGEFLATRLARHGGDLQKQLHQRAARWFAEHRCLTEAVRHASLGEDLDFATQVIERTAPSTWSLEYLGPTLHLLERLPEEVLLRHKRLLFLACLTVSLTSRPARAKAWLQHLSTADLQGLPEIANGLPMIRAAIAVQDDDTDLVIELLEPLRDASVENPFLRYVLLSALTVAYSAAGRYSDARRLFDQHPIPPEDRGNDMAMVAEFSSATNLVAAGNFRDFEKVGSQLLEHSTREGGNRSICANLCASALTEVFYELDRIDDSRETIANRFGLLHSSVPDVIVRTNVTRVRLDLLQKGSEAALAFLEQQIAHLRCLGQVRPVAQLLGEEIRVLLLKGSRGRAGELLETLDELARQHGTERGARAELPAIAALARARVLKAEDSEQTLAQLEIVRAYAKAFDRGRMAVLADLLAASTLEDLKRPDEALQRARQAVSDGQRFGLVRTFIDEGPLAERLLARLVEEQAVEGEVLAYTEELLAKLNDPFAVNASAPRPRRALPTKTQAVLTKREIDILALVAQAMSSKRIAHTLDITLETVKWNLRNIFAKLGVSSRYDAMIWAKNHNLIE